MGNKIWSSQEEAHLLYEARKQKLTKISKVKANKGMTYLPTDCKKVEKLAQEISAKYGQTRKVGSIISKYRDIMTIVGKVPGVTVDSITDSYIENAIREKEQAMLNLRLEHMESSFEPDPTPDSNYLMIDLVRFNRAWGNSTNVWDCLNEASVCD
jgi:hypothetical protein